jgi:NADH-quinone oxidoreductase subunit L
MDDFGWTLAKLLMVAWLLPLLGFFIEVTAGYWGRGCRLKKTAAYIAIGCIGAGFVSSCIAWSMFESHKAEAESVALVDIDAIAPEAGLAGDAGLAGNEGQPQAGLASVSDDVDAGHAKKVEYSGIFYTLARFGDLEVTLDYYIDSFTILMFCMVTLIATCIHVFAVGYMSDELTDDYEDHFAHDSKGHVHRPGRFYKFFAFMSLFCFSMLGIVIAGNIFQVFVFWELVGICSYLLIGFYTERDSANVAANKAFIVNRVGDFGFIVGLMILWTYCGTFRFNDYEAYNGAEKPGLFNMIRDHEGNLHESGDSVVLNTHKHGDHWESEHDKEDQKTIPYTLLVIAGLGIFAGCIGKSAQFPLQTWLPDAMEGPTPVSALVHSATMVAAGVYLAGRFYPVFTSEVLLAIAYIGCITLFVAATIAVVATDIKRVLAYSTISQLGYMMLAIGLGGWIAGLMHLITHAFFKSLMFLCSGSVIHGCHHEQEMPKMGGLLKKMPITGITMLIGVVAIAGLGIPGVIAFSGFYSKDEIMATSLAYTKLNRGHFLLFIVPLITAGITSFYMFRLWFYTFAGKPRDQDVYDNCHESPKVMYVPLLILAFFAAFIAWGGTIHDEKNDIHPGPLYTTISESAPASIHAAKTSASGVTTSITLPSHDDIHGAHATAGVVALLAAVIGLIVAFFMYCRPILDPATVKAQLPGVHRFLIEKWQFDNLYEVMFVRPARLIGRWCIAIDRIVFDGFLHLMTRTAVWIAHWDRKFDEAIVDGLVNTVGGVTRSFGESLKVIQTGRIRQYVMFIAMSVIGLFAIFFAFLQP